MNKGNKFRHPPSLEDIFDKWFKGLFITLGIICLVGGFFAPHQFILSIVCFLNALIINQK